MGKRGPGLKKAEPKMIELPLSYVLASEEAVNALSMLVDDGLSVEAVKAALAALKKHGAQEGKLTPEARRVLDIWD